MLDMLLIQNVISAIECISLKVICLSAIKLKKVTA